MFIEIQIEKLVLDYLSTINTEELQFWVLMHQK